MFLNLTIKIIVVYILNYLFFVSQTLIIILKILLKSSNIDLIYLFKNKIIIS